MQIESGRIINDFIEPNKKQYAIPVYQRNYEWSKEQCIKLFEDIVNAYKREKNHFCGSVVYAGLKEEHGIQYYVIIDGQQRMTTVYLLLKALMDKASTDKDRETIESTMLNRDKFDPFSIDKASKLKLKPVKTDNSQLSLLMEGKFDDIDKTSGIWKNYELFCQLIEEQNASDTPLEIKEIYSGIERLMCAKIKLGEDDNAQEIFERINSTGVPLSLADKIRNYVLMTDANQEKLYENYWLKIEKLVTKEEMNSFFEDYLNLKVEGSIKQQEAYETFKRLFVQKGYSNEGILQELLRYAGYFHCFMHDSSKYSASIDSSLKGLRQLKQTTMYVFLFRIFDDFNDSVITEKELEKVLCFLLNYSVRHIMCELGSNSLRGLYKTLYSRVFSKLENKSNYYDSIVCFFKQLTTKDALPQKVDFVDALKHKNLYRKNALCRLLLSTIENNGKEKVATDVLTIEHVMPQNNDLSQAWKDMLGADWKETHDTYLHTLGNLTLTGYNSELGDKPFDVKKQLLQDKASKMVALNEDILNQAQWEKSTIEARATKLALKINDLFGIEAPEKEISFADPRYKEHNCDNADEATHTNPNYYVLLGERVLVSTYADMLRSVVSKLYVLDSTIIEEFARLDSSVVPTWSSIMFTYEKDKGGCKEEIQSSGIFHNVSYSASHVIVMIQNLLDSYEIDRSEFLYSARSNRN